MNTVTWVVIVSVVIAFIAVISIFIIKNLLQPQKVSTVKKLIKEGKYSQAVKIAKNILSKDPKDWETHYWLGKAYLSDNKPELALIEYKNVNQNMVFKGDISEVEFRKDFASLCKKYNQTEEALKQYLLLTKMEPQNADNDYNVGQIYEAQGQSALAMGFYQKALTVNKKHAKAYTSMGYLLYRSKQYGEAKSTIETAIKLNPSNYSNYYYLGKIYKDSKDLSSAVKAFEKAARDPEFRQKALIEKGSCLMLAGLTDQAINDFDLAIHATKDQNSKETLFARYFLGACYEKTHKIEKALEQWEKIYAINKKFKDVGTKLNQYKDIQTNDGMKEYLTASAKNFTEICKKLALVGFNLNAQKIEPTNFGCQMLATEDKQQNWTNIRHEVFLLQFYRDTEPLEDNVVRKAVDIVKAQGFQKGIIVSSSGFTPLANSYAENRAVNLVPKEQLESIFRTSGI